MGSGSLYWLLGVTEEIPNSATALSFCGCVFINSSPFIWNQMLIYQDLYDAWPGDKAHYFRFLPTSCFKGSFLSLIIEGIISFKPLRSYISFVLFSSGCLVCLDYVAIWTLRKRQVFETFHMWTQGGGAQSRAVPSKGESKGVTCAKQWWPETVRKMVMETWQWICSRQIGMFFLVPDERYCWWKMSRNHHLTCKPCT